MAAEDGSTNAFSTTVALIGEDHTLAQALCAMLNRKYPIGVVDPDPFTALSPHVMFCGADAPHPSDDFINIRIQTSGAITAKQALKQATKEVKRVLEYIKQEFVEELTRYQV